MPPSAPALVRATILLAVAITGWAVLAWMALDMGHPWVQWTMPGGSDWSLANVLAIFTMWAVMMAAMMLPSALPMVLGFVRLSLQQAAPARAGLFVLAYLLVWGGFSALATGLQWLLQRFDWVDPMIVSTSTALDGALLLVAGAYQFSPLKRLCLARCRSPVGFLLGDWRPGAKGAFVMGLRHGLFCLGCCWALMVLLFVGGAMNLAWVAALAVGVAIEKLMPRGQVVATALGLLLIAAGTWKLCGLPGLTA